ncbi:tape measure protein [Pediococcus pentosaceus]|uniref:tape measure protein n=2 Tax=Lactobacillaceae TaxID=33958 RepID=UPI000E07ED93|nr:tape measure protein [Pediococcus pentosaceus]AXR43511.1 peptidase M23 [Pediococcus pentosaceus]KAF0520000.1 peptidoglycan DD-metalloendopeptidase family protein [Pediococcus pentosaceus]MBF7110761.1 peptidoglycan DD-metalloendopeptidase family protein [Pediococcus pentosaceus]MBF7117734.1 peptidoglycan DD-metalloendopeptidase family protein [Pediococcus pentosaceus]MCS8578026.1 peptidase M23 [Pediococcus pentosaceus]
MASKVDSIMSTAVALETLKASNSINSLTKAVKGSTSAWKAQEAQLKSSGDYLKASEAKYEGLGKSIEAERKRIEVLQEKMKDLDQTTQDGAKQAVKYGTDLDKATTALKSMEAQQQRAHEALKREESGINSLNSSMRQRNSLSKAVTDRLEAEGKHEQALKEKRDNARKSIDDTSKALKKEEALLKDLEKNNGSASAINKQRIAVEKLKTSMAESKSSVSKFDKSIKELNPSPIQRLGKSFSRLKKEGKETHSIFKSVFAANIVSNIFTNTLGTISTKLHDMWSNSMEYAKAQQTMNASWLTLTGNAKEGQKMVNMTNDMAASFANSTDMVNDLNQKFYSISDSSKTTKQLTTDVLTLQDAFGKTDDEVKNFSTQYSQMMANGKVSAQDMMSFVNVFPKIRTELLKTEQKITGNHDLSMKQLNDMISNGEVSSKTMQKVMDSMQKKYSGATANFGKTFDGMNRTVNARVPALLSAFTTPLLKMRNPFLGTISKWVSDPRTEKSFGKLGDTASKGFGTITDAFSKALNFKGGFNSDKIFKSISKTITSLSSTIAKHAKDIIGFFKGLWDGVKILGSIGTGFFKGLIGGLSAVVKPLAKMAGHSKKVKGLSGALGELSKHKQGLETLGKILAGVFIAKKIAGFTSSLVHAGVKIRDFAKDVKEDARLIRDSLKWTANVSKKAATKTISVLSKTAKATGKGIGKALKFTAKVSSKVATTALNGLRKAASLTGKAFLSMGKFMLANPFVAIAAAVVGVSVALYELYKHNKKFRKFVNGIAKAVSNFTKNALKGIKKFFSNVTKSFSSFGKSFKKAWNNTWKSVKNFFSDIFNGIHKKFKSWTTAISKTWTGFKSWFNKKWKGMWNGVRDLFGGMTKGLSKTFSNWTSGTVDALGSFGNKFKSGWNGLVKGVKNIFSGLWKEMKKMASDGINGVIDIVNKGIGGVNWVINKFGGSKQTIKPIGHVKFATGTGSLGSSNFRRAINSITPAIVNDEVGASNPELIFRKATGTVEYSKEKNAETMLFPGDEVANATDSAKLAPMLGITHFAGGGIGDFFGGIISGAKSIFKKITGGLKGLFDVGTKIISNPGKALESLMPFSKGNTKGFFPTIAKGSFNFVKKQAGKWWSTLWDMVSLSGDGNGSYGGGWQSPGSGWTHTDGFGSPRSGGVHDGNDFSARVGTAFHAMHGGTVIRVGGAPAGWGPVGYNIVTRDSTGKEIIYQEFGNAKDVKVHKGQKVKTGDTLGVLGRSGLGTGPHLHVGLTNGGSVWGRSGMSTKGWLDITKQHGKDKGSDTDSDTNNSLQKTIKKQVGSGFWKTISKIASMFGDDGGSGDPGGAGVQRWKSDVKSALSKLGLSTSASMVSRVLRQINTESGGNPKAMGGTDGLADGHAEGLMQVKPGTFSAYHLSGHNNIWNGYDNILAGLNYAKHRYGSGLSFLGNGHGYANGGIANTPSIFGEAGPEMAIPLSMTRSDRANQLLGETIVHMAKNNPDPLPTSVNNSTGSTKELDEVKKLLKDAVDQLRDVTRAIYDTALTPQTVTDVVNKRTLINKTQYNRSRGLGGI